MDGCDAVLESKTVFGGTTVNGVDLIQFDDDGRIVQFQVMLRPMKAINQVGRRMLELLGALREPVAV